MDGLCRAVASPLPVEMFGRTVMLYPLRLKDLGTIELSLLAKRRRIHDVLPKLDGLGSITSLAKAKAVSRWAALPNHIDPGTINTFLASHQGLALSLWLMLRTGRPSTLRRLRSWTRNLPEPRLLHWLGVRNMVSGLDEMAMADWKVAGFDPAENDNSEDAKFSWKGAIRAVCEAYLGLTPETVGELTLYQFRELAADSDHVKGKMKLSKDDPRVREHLKRWRAEQEQK